MITKRRDFIKMATMAGLSLASANALFAQHQEEKEKFNDLPKRIKKYQKKHQQLFNMSGYVAPKITLSILYGLLIPRTYVIHS